MMHTLSTPVAHAPRTADGTRVPPVPIEHEELVVRRGRRSGAEIVIAIHSTALGPALGGARLWRYASPIDALHDACRLSRAMSLKASAAGLDLGGGKAVLCAPPGAPPSGDRRRELLLDFGDLLESLEGRYVTAEDVGTGTSDMAVIAERTAHVVGLAPEDGGSGDPSPYTARGVLAAVKGAVGFVSGAAEIDGLEVCLVGLGHVGTRLADLLADAGAELTVSDIDPAKRRLADVLGARWVDPADAITTSCDLLVPCALGGAIDHGNAELLRCRTVCGSANNVLADEGLAAVLAERGIVYVPDFLANAGGLISVYRELRGFGEERALELVDGIEIKVAAVLEDAAASGRTPLESALELARRRLLAAEAVKLNRDKALTNGGAGA